jgi:hemerythrin-like domain-containing protein
VITLPVRLVERFPSSPVDMPKRHPSLVPLSHDHHHGLALALRCRKQALGQIKPVGVEGLRLRASEFLSFYATELSSHFEAEEKILFPQMSLYVPESQQLIADLVRDHETVRSATAKLESTTGLGKVMFDLGDLLERHIRREERELFPLFEQHAAVIEADAIAEKLVRFLAGAREGESAVRSHS